MLGIIHITHTFVLYIIIFTYDNNYKSKCALKSPPALPLTPESRFNTVHYLFCNEYHQQQQFLYSSVHSLYLLKGCCRFFHMIQVLLFSGNGRRCTLFYEQALNSHREQRQNGLILHPDMAYIFLCSVVFRKKSAHD